LILVTGATGFIGSRLVDRLIQLGLPVVANFRTPREDVPRIWNTWIGDLAQPNVAARLISDTSPRQVIHLAGLVQSETALPLLRATFESNVLATFNLLSAVAESESPCPLIYAGTVDDCLGGLSPTTPYSLSKLVTREYFQYFQLEQPGRWCEARIYTGYGPGQSAGKVIPQLITTYLTGGVPNILHPNRVREWVYVEDIVDALVHLATSNSTLPTRVEVRSGVETRASRARSCRASFQPLHMGVATQDESRGGTVEDRSMVPGYARVLNLAGVPLLLRFPLCCLYLPIANRIGPNIPQRKSECFTSIGNAIKVRCELEIDKPSNSDGG